MCWTWRYWILGAGAFGLALALAISLLLPPLYRSSVLLELNPPTISVASESGTTDSSFATPVTDYEFLRTQYGLLRSKELARRVVQDLDLAAKSENAGENHRPEVRIRAIAERISRNIDVAPEEDSRLVKLTYTSEVAVESAHIVNGYAQAYLESNLDRKYEASATARKFLKERLKATRSTLDAAERKLVEYAKENNLIMASGEAGQVSGSGSLAGSSLASLNSAFAAAQQRRIAAEQRYRQASSITEVNQATASLREERAKLQTEISEKSTYLKDDYPEMLRLRSRIDALDEAIRKEAGTSSGSLRAEYQAAVAEESALRAKVSQLSASVLDERERAVQYNMLQRELDTNHALYDALLKRYNNVTVAGDFDTPQASIIDEGEIPSAPYFPNIPFNLLIGLLLGLGVGTIFAIAYEILTDTVKSPDDVREKLRLAVIGVIPKKKKKENLAEQFADPRSPLSEAYTSLLTTLQFTTSEGFPSALLVTSTLANEGKSTTSFVLASKLAQIGKKVIFLDADMRKPSFIFEERSDLGLSRLLTSVEPVQEHILSTENQNLSLMPSGPIPPNPSQLLNSARMSEILNELRQQFDCIIIDSPPAHGLPDAALLGSMCSGVLLVIESRRVRRKVILEVIANFRSTGNVLFGAALTKYDSETGHYGYTYRYNNDMDFDHEQLKSHELTPVLVLSDRT